MRQQSSTFDRLIIVFGDSWCILRSASPRILTPMLTLLPGKSRAPDLVFLLVFCIMMWEFSSPLDNVILDLEPTTTLADPADIQIFIRHRRRAHFTFAAPCHHAISLSLPLAFSLSFSLFLSFLIFPTYCLTSLQVVLTSRTNIRSRHVTHLLIIFPIHIRYLGIDHHAPQYLKLVLEHIQPFQAFLPLTRPFRVPTPTSTPTLLPMPMPIRLVLITFHAIILQQPCARPLLDIVVVLEDPLFLDWCYYLGLFYREIFQGVWGYPGVGSGLVLGWGLGAAWIGL